MGREKKEEFGVRVEIARTNAVAVHRVEGKGRKKM